MATTEIYNNATVHLSDSLATLYTSSTNADKYSIIHSLFISNKTAAIIIVDLIVEKGGSDYYVQQGIEIYPNSGFSLDKSINLLNGQKIKAISNIPNSADIVLSVLELNINDLPPTANLTAYPTTLSVAVNQAFSVQFVAVDPQGDPLTYSTPDSIAGVILDTNTGIVSGTPTATGVNTLNITADDGNGNTHTNILTLTVT